MKPTFATPRLLVSRCLGFEACRWNGLCIDDPVVARLRPHVECLTPCPEADVGLGIPRDPIRVIQTDAGERLVQPATGRDITDAMLALSHTILDGMPELDGAILKHKSPSCGIGSVKLHPHMGACGAIGKTNGFFTRVVQERLPDLPLEDEGRLTNFRIREHFFTQIFCLAAFRELRAGGGMRELVDFHTRHKELLRAYHQGEKAELGRIVANPEHESVPTLLERYGVHLRRALARPPRRPAVVNVLEHCLGYFSKELTPGEKAHFLAMIGQYREERLPLSACLSVLQSWMIRYDRAYLSRQVFFHPYPDTLFEIHDSGQGRDIRA